MKFVIDSIQYTGAQNNQDVFRDENTIGYTFINAGNCNVTLNNYTLTPNSTLKTYEFGMVDITSWRVLFNTFDACSTSNSLLVVLIYSKR